MAVLGSYFFRPQFFNAENGGTMPIVLLIPSIVITTLIILRIKKSESMKVLRRDQLTI
jgi:hypothetical protein